ncbi:MAG TPA: LLM class F420-dependent oxidoreductase [Vicinamibacteria bacterium]|nr:LLM class F420-dependent oxidoreductase [Vicinamibacteria bacterium]
MKLGLSLGFLTSANLDLVPLAVQAEKLGYDSVWVAEAWGSDAVSLLAWIGASTERIELGTAILQIPARSPALTAMTAATLDRLSNGRLLLGLGVSGPQVVEGWHGVPYGRPLTRTRDAVEIIRRILARKQPLTYAGKTYRIPLDGGTGLGKPLKLMMPPLRPDIPIYLAAIGPKNVALATEIADGWLPIFFAPRNARLFGEMPQRTFDVAPTVHVALGDDVQECLDAVKPNLALYVGGMGAKGKNFYNDLARRYGYEKEAEQIQELYLGGKKKEAVAAVPDGLVDEVALCGPKERIVDRLGAWREAGVTTLICIPSGSEAFAEMPEIVARA